MMMTASQPMILRPRSSDTHRPILLAVKHDGSFGRFSGSSCFLWLLLAVCILVDMGGTSAMPATKVEGQEIAEGDLGALLDAGDGAVVTLVAGKTRLAVHRAVLAARSPVFATMFAHVPLEASSGDVVIRDVEGPVLRKLVAFLYSGRAPQVTGMAPQILEAAQMYSVSSLKNAFEQQLAEQLTVDNAAATAVLAVTHNYSSLTQAAVAFIRDHSFQVMATQGWAEAVHSYPGAVVDFTRLLVELTTETSAPATVGSKASPTTQSNRDNHQTAAAATSSSACPHTTTLDDAAISHFRSLSGEERGNRLRQAAQEGAVQEVRTLLAAGADVRAGDEVGWTALHDAARAGHVEVARRLLQAGAEVDARDISQWTPLHAAAKYGHAAVVRLLLAASADPNRRSLAERTPLHLAARDGHAEAATALLAAGADRVARDKERRTPLDLAREKNQQHLIQILERY